MHNHENILYLKLNMCHEDDIALFTIFIATFFLTPAKVFP